MMVGVVVLTSPAVRAAEFASDNASQAVYQDGWQAGDNGGIGFRPWTVVSNGGIAEIGSSTANGDLLPPAGDIDSAGGRAWSLASGPSGTTVMAVRPLAGALSVGQSISFDLDGICGHANPDILNVGVGNAAAARWGLTIHASGTHMGDGRSSGGTLAANETREGMHVEFTLLGSDLFTASLRVLDGSDPVVVGGDLDGTAGSAIDRITFSVAPGFGPVDAFYLNNLAVTPEPGVGMPAVVAGVLFMRRRRRG